MNQVNYNKDYSRKIKKHLHLLKQISDYWEEKKVFEQIKSDYINWAVDFIYWDIIRLCATDKKEIAKMFLDYLSGINIFDNYHLLQEEQRVHFDYIHNLSKEVVFQPVFSVVVYVNSAGDQVQRLIDSIVAQSFTQTEILIYDYSQNEQCNKKLFSLLEKDSRVSLRLIDTCKTLADVYNDAMLSAKGQYIAFISVFDYYISPDYLRDAEDCFKKNNADMVGGFGDDVFGIREKTECQNKDFYQFAYDLNFLKKNKILFNDYSMWTGKVFFTECCLKAEKICNVKQGVKRNDNFRRTSIYNVEARLILKAAIRLLEVADCNGLTELRKKVIDKFNGENYTRLITDATFGFAVDADSSKDEKSKYNDDIFKMLVMINRYASQESTDKCILRTLERFVKLRYLFLDSVGMISK